MAEKEINEETEGKGEGKEVEKEKNSFLKWIILAVIISILGSGGFFAWAKFMLPEKTESPIEAPTQETQMGPIYSLDTFIVNLSGAKGRRYLKVKMELELANENVYKEVEKKLPQMRDAILVLLSSKSFEQIEDVGGKNRLRDEIIARSNGFLTSGLAKQVYFTEFVVQ
ncbi:MAG: flagellar basal body-associated FliL family protein [Thermodesulfobacteriota bacterium]|nr:flagellar basal body-associated FliL family protein [Thermodesulfobacteriota bacterium]